MKVVGNVELIDVTITLSVKDAKVLARALQDVTCLALRPNEFELIHRLHKELEQVGS